MKRITNRVAHYGHSVLRYVGQYKHQPEGDAPAEVCHSGVLDLMSKLAKYEDTGLEPEEIAAKLKWADHAADVLNDIFGNMGVFDISLLRNLVKAEQEGRLVVLPKPPKDVER